METTLHRQLKARYGPDRGGRSEVVVEGFRIDAIGPDGRLVEVQSGALGPLRGKLGRLLPGHGVRVVKPVAIARRIVRRARPDGVDLAARFSPRRGAVADVFDDLIGLARIFPDPNLQIEVLAVEIDEVRVPWRRRPGYRVVDRVWRRTFQTWTLRLAADLWTLIPPGLPAPFTTLDLARVLGRPVGFAQRVAYCLRMAGAAREVGKVGNRRVYEGRDRSADDADDRRLKN